MVEIRIGANIVNEVTSYETLHGCNGNDKKYIEMNARLWVDLEDLLLDLKSLLENPTYSHMKQAVEDLINELEE